MALILVVDDSKFQRGMVTRILKQEGHDIIEAKNGKVGLEVVSTQKPDCILMDLLMPELNGIETLRIMREQALETPVIVLTSDIQEDVRKECLDLGAHGFLNKPPKADQIREALYNVLPNMPA